MAILGVLGTTRCAILPKWCVGGWGGKLAISYNLSYTQPALPRAGSADGGRDPGHAELLLRMEFISVYKFGSKLSPPWYSTVQFCVYNAH